MYRQEQIMVNPSPMVFANSNGVDNELALLAAKCVRLKESCKKLLGYSISFASSGIHVQPKKHPITAFEKALVKKFEDTLNKFEDVYSALSVQEIREIKNEQCAACNEG